MTPVELLFLYSILRPSCGFADSAVLARGKKVYETNCLTCHGVKGDGNGPAAAAIRPNKPRNFTLGQFKYGSTPELLLKTITHGIDGTPMPSWAGLPEEDRRAVIVYVRAFKK